MTLFTSFWCQRTYSLCKFLLCCIHACTLTHAHNHTHYTLTHTHTEHTNAHVHTHTQAHTHRHKYTHSHTHTLTHTLTHTQTHTHAHIDTHAIVYVSSAPLCFADRKLVSSQVSMSEAERDRIMKEHEKQMVLLENRSVTFFFFFFSFLNHFLGLSPEACPCHAGLKA